MKEKLGSCSGKWLIKELIKKFDYRKIRQRGSHVRLSLEKGRISVPLHSELGEGIKANITKEVAEQNSLSVEEVIKKLKE